MKEEEYYARRDSILRDIKRFTEDMTDTEVMEFSNDVLWELNKIREKNNLRRYTIK